MWSEILLIVCGIALLYGGAELLVRACVAVAERLGLSPMLIALTVVSFVTSMPEGVTSIVAQTKELPDVAMGNIIGSTAANIGLVLAIALLIRPPDRKVSSEIQPLVIMIGALFFLWALLLLGPIGPWKGTLAITLLLAYLTWQVRHVPRTAARRSRPLFRSFLFLIIGVVMLTLGAEGLITGGVSLGERLGLSNRIIGLTVVAIGTSLPELATAIIASMRRHTDVIVGNVIGSNLFNCLFVVALASFVAPVVASPRMAHVDAPVSIALSLMLLAFALFRLPGRLIGGAILVSYLIYLFLAS